MEPLFLLIYINDLLEGLITKVKLFPDDASLLLVVQDINASTEEQNNNLGNISEPINIK